MTQLKKSEAIDQALDLAPMQTFEVEKVPQEDINVKTDFEYARGNLINIIEKGNEALDGILDVAGMSQHPRSFEVAATIINSLAAANKDLLELSKRRKELEGEKSPTTINNNLFVGSTAELQKLIKNNGAKE
jgi:hypothetical protein